MGGDDTERRATRRSLLGGATAAAAAGVLSEPAWARPARGRARRRRKRFSQTPVIAGEVILAARSIGSGEPIVIHPSLARGARDFDPLARHLARRGYRAIAVDPRGIGDSWAPTSAIQDTTLHTYAGDLLAVIRHFELKKVHVLGHAYGNRVARTLAADHPEVVRTVITCAVGSGAPHQDVLEGLLALTDPDTPAGEVPGLVRSLFFAPGSDPRPWYVGWNPIGGRQELLSVARTDFAPLEGGGSAPMLVVQGKRDVVAPPEIGHELRAKYGQRITVRDIARTGHAMIAEKPAKIADVIADYLARRRNRRG